MQASAFSVDDGRIYREISKPEFFTNPQATSFEFGLKKIEKIPFNPDFENKITRARFLGCCLTSVPRGLELYPRISMLDLTENQISSLGKDELSRFTCLQSLYLTANRLTSFRVSISPTLTTLDLSFNPQICVEDVWSLDLPNLEVVKLTHCGVHKLPDASPNWLSTVRTIHLDGNFLEELPSYFDEFEVLEELSLFGNKLKKIDTSLLPQQFKTLTFYFNYIDEWEGDEPLHVVTLNLNTNLFRSFPIGVLDTIGLRALTLAHCNIEGSINFIVPEQLAALDLSYNEINEIGADFLGSISKLSSLNMSNNKIASISDSFPERIALSRLLLDFNCLTTLPDTFVNCSRLDQISISNNKLIKFPPINCPFLRILNLSFNELEELPDTFTKSTFLTDINLAFNNLTTLPHSLASCRKVIDFNLSGNKLKAFPKCLFSFSQLKSLIISKNDLSTIPMSLQSFFFLQNLDLSNNHFNSVPVFISQFMTLRILSMSHNLISEFPADFSLPPALTFLDFSYNKIKKFEFSAQNAQSINLDCNLLSTFNPELFPAAKFISINHNPFTAPFPPLIMSLFGLQGLGAFEMLKCGSFAGEVPPLRFHILSDSHVSYCKQFGIGYSSTMGVRPTMEDAVTFQAYENDQALFALFDGHQGNVAAVTSALCLHNEIQRALKAKDNNIPAMLTSSFISVNQKLRQMSVRDGCTAVAAFIKGTDCYTVGIGDSRIVRVKNDSEERVTTDYKPTMRSEYERLRDSGSTVNSEGRIGRKLAVARSMGDFWCEGNSLFVPPEVNQFSIDENDYALIIACDGVWDVITDHYAAQIIRQSSSAQDAASQLRNTAFALGSKDNISAIVVFLHPLSDKVGFEYVNEIVTMPPVVEELDNDAALGVQIPSAAKPPARRRR